MRIKVKVRKTKYHQAMDVISASLRKSPIHGIRWTWENRIAGYMVDEMKAARVGGNEEKRWRVALAAAKKYIDHVIAKKP